MKERRGRACSAGGTRKGRPPKLDKKVEEDLIAENQRLRMEIEYLKKLECLSSCGRARERQKAKIISELRQKYHAERVALNYPVLHASTYYYYLKQPNTDKYECEKQEIQEIYEYE